MTPEIQQLQNQQAILTQALRAMLEGNWCGAPPSVQAYVGALDPALNPQCVPPYRETDIPPPAPEHFFDPYTTQLSQVYDWTCSACALEWLLRAYDSSYGSDVYANREQAVYDIGYPSNISSSLGLHDSSGTQLRRVFSDRVGMATGQGWLTFDQMYSIASQGYGGMLSGAAWYHWVGLRGVYGGDLWIANSAPGYRSIWDVLDRASYNQLGPFSCVWVQP